MKILKTLQKRFRRVRPHENFAEILFQHGNARPHTHTHTHTHTLTHTGLETILNEIVSKLV
jgi:hypothetical protein